MGYVGFTVLPPLLDQEPWNVGRALGLAAWLLVLGTGAEILRTRRERRAELAHVQAEEARRRASEERLRIARELHDVLAHNISLINVQAGVALHLMDEQPEQARPALTAIKDASKDALGELRSVLDVLRRSEDEATAPRAPTAGLRRPRRRWSSARATAGLDVDAGRLGRGPAGARRRRPGRVPDRAGGADQRRPPRRHRPARAVRLDYGDDQLTVQVDDDGRARHAPLRRAPGGGIAGMRERAQALGGTLRGRPPARRRLPCPRPLPDREYVAP